MECTSTASIELRFIASNGFTVILDGQLPASFSLLQGADAFNHARTHGSHVSHDQLQVQLHLAAPDLHGSFLRGFAAMRGLPGFLPHGFAWLG